MANLNSDRLPYYARIDGRITFRPGGPGSRWMIYAEVLNILDRANAGSRMATLAYNPEEEGLPRLPSGDGREQDEGRGLGV